MSEFYPTLFFGFNLNKGKEVLHQMWVDQLWATEWRPVPMMELGSNRKPAEAGNIGDYTEEEFNG